jgi:glutamate synthase (NADPH/NADH) large chain
MIQTEQLESSKDIERVKALIQTHYEYTGSQKAKMILDNWEIYSGKFLKVCSPAYEKQLEQAV